MSLARGFSWLFHGYFSAPLYFVRGYHGYHGYNIFENINIGVRYSLGLSNIADVDGFDVNLKNSNFSLGLGYKF